MKYYLFKERKGMALYRTIGNKTSRYLDFFPEKTTENIELMLFETKEQAQLEIEMLDNHFGEYGWEVKEYNLGE